MQWTFLFLLWGLRETTVGRLTPSGDNRELGETLGNRGKAWGVRGNPKKPGRNVILNSPRIGGKPWGLGGNLGSREETLGSGGKPWGVGEGGGAWLENYNSN